MGRLLKPGLSSTGYPTVMLGRKGGSRCLHDLVLAAFVGPRPEGFDACHKDGDKIHNTVTNLRWGTRADNMRDLTRHGGRKLTLNQAKWCRERAGLGETQTALAREFGVCVSQMNNIVHGRRYAR